MRILYVTNAMPPQGCGVASFGKQQIEALRKAGCDVTEWTSWPPVYLPDNASEFDIIHLNWMPLTLGHIQAQHLPKGPLLSGHIHEYSSSWEKEHPPIFDCLQVKFSSEPVPFDPNVIWWQIPVPDYVPQSYPHESFDPQRGVWNVLVGHTGLRGDGLDRIGPACEKNGWQLSTSKDAGKWLPLEEEIERLAKCHVVVVQNHGGYSGQASAVSTAIASRRPVVINSGRMLSCIKRINEEEYGGGEIYCIEDAEEAVRTVLEEIREGREKRPFRLAEDYSWTNQTKKLIKEWEKHL